MSDFLYSLDLRLFYAINHGSANPVFDVVMPFITDVNNFLVVYILALALLLWKGGSRGRWCVLLILLTVAISDPLNSRVIKEVVERVRPCSALDNVRVLIGCGAGKSFPSSHAVNNFAAAVVVGFFYRRLWLYFFLYAMLVAYSRVYVGVHYPGDVIGGALEGALIAIALVFVWSRLYQRFTGVAAWPEYDMPARNSGDTDDVEKEI